MSDDKLNSEFKATQKQNKHINLQDKIVTLSSESTSCSSFDKDYIDKFQVIILKKILNINKLIVSLTKRINKLEKSVDIRNLSGILNKHYEQSGCCK